MPGAPLVLHLVAELGDLDARTLGRDLALHVAGKFGVVGLDTRLDLVDLDDRDAEMALDRLADLACREREGGIADGGFECGFGHEPQIDVGGAQSAFLAEVLEGESAGEALARGLRLGEVREHDLVDLALLRCGKQILALIEQLLRVVIGDVAPLGDLLRRDHGEDDLAEFGRAELDLVILEIGGERLGRGRVDRACLRRVEPDEFDRALFVLEARRDVEHGRRRLEAGTDRAGDLPAQCYLALLGHVALLGVAEIADQALEAVRIEFAVDALEVRVVHDELADLVVGLAESEPARVFIEGGFRKRLLQHLAIKAKRACLFRRQRAAELAADLLEAVGVDLAELVQRNLGVPDLGHRGLAEAAEDVGNPPNAEADDQHAHHDGHDGLADPV
ncbi:hypothetical protein ACVWYH_008716 [Bradyrhizobium sp. GM24.11]